ncbi:Uncharacterised protein [BD1-7 clade bacterium]|uniref:Uncharacterized protein n=1 Tax=BD1-7 clade bacterium TaxID=2029982 RepID=A0A5S9PH33_9GAMM|nr:Uncharacterised protein [BD1-7 clade bacterium]CAA0103322.1 Uncharacterised protein [BD1-7 clade bacterium]
MTHTKPVYQLSVLRLTLEWRDRVMAFAVTSYRGDILGVRGNLYLLPVSSYYRIHVHIKELAFREGGLSIGSFIDKTDFFSDVF